MQKIKIEIKWAVIFIFMTLIWMVLEKLAGFHSSHIDKHAIVTNLIAIPAVAIYLFALLEKRNRFYKGSMNYKQGFVCGLILTVIITIFSPLTQFITSNVITPEYFPNIINYTVAQGEMSQTEAENYFNLKNYIIQGLIGAFAMGILTSAIIAFFVKTKRST